MLGSTRAAIHELVRGRREGEAQGRGREGVQVWTRGLGDVQGQTRGGREG